MHMHDVSQPERDMHARQEALLEILEASRCAPQHYREVARAWLEREIGFDGSVWGCGRRAKGGAIEIDSADLVGRPQALLDGFASIAELDPVSRRFGVAPRQLQNIRVSHDYRQRQVRPVASYLRKHHVGQLMLCGAACGPDGQLAWLTLYREEQARPFSERDAEIAAFALPFVLLAEGPPPVAAPRSDPPRPETVLTPREQEVASAYAAGGDYKSVARVLALSPATVRSHLLSIFRKLSVHNKIELHRRLQGDV